MGKAFVLGMAIAVGYALGYRDARAHPDHVLSRVVDVIRATFSTGGGGNDVDAVMNRLEGKP